MPTYIVLDADGYAVAEEYANEAEAEQHALRIGGSVLTCDDCLAHEYDEQEGD